MTGYKIKRWCPAVLPWPGHPNGNLLCEKWEGHVGPHQAGWHEGENMQHERRMKWTDGDAEKARARDGG